MCLMKFRFLIMRIVFEYILVYSIKQGKKLFLALGQKAPSIKVNHNKFDDGNVKRVFKIYR